MQVKKKYLTLHSRLRKTPNTATPGAVVQLVRIRACHARGRGFEPHPHRKNASHTCEGHFSYSLQRLHPRRAFPATWFIFCDLFRMFILYRENVLDGTERVCKHTLYRLKRFPRTTSQKITCSCANRAFLRTRKKNLTTILLNSNRRREPCKDLPMPDFRGSWPR